eukprot:4992173-Pyramimonas_sp.AAC.1
MGCIAYTVPHILPRMDGITYAASHDLSASVDSKYIVCDDGDDDDGDADRAGDDAKRHRHRSAQRWCIGIGIGTGTVIGVGTGVRGEAKA